MDRRASATEGDSRPRSPGSTTRGKRWQTEQVRAQWDTRPANPVSGTILFTISEKQIAQRFLKAGRTRENHHLSLHLRAMNMLFEGLKEKGAMLIVLSRSVDTVNLGGLAGMAALSNTLLPRPIHAKAEEEQESGV